jgi:hypothetical protein
MPNRMGHRLIVICRVTFNDAFAKTRSNQQVPAVRPLRGGDVERRAVSDGSEEEAAAVRFHLHGVVNASLCQEVFDLSCLAKRPRDEDAFEVLEILRFDVRHFRQVVEVAT